MEIKFSPPQWLIEGLLPEGLSILSGAPKIGKSWLSLQIALAVTTASPLFGRVPNSEKSVLLLALEDNERRLKDRISKCGLPTTDSFYITTQNNILIYTIKKLLTKTGKLKNL